MSNKELMMFLWTYYSCVVRDSHSLSVVSVWVTPKGSLSSLTNQSRTPWSHS